ncbi:hypothetical protein [uncultured Anaerovibrio sp.]|uniref:hypothetical protein n=1 Tax=uncultured Anaerovibrio sp. TaxID=361586 RepID=UPI00260ECBAB|nr:hypothetical protein [uncultured Anaerovibrio sp.]
MEDFSSKEEKFEQWRYNVIAAAAISVDKGVSFKTLASDKKCILYFIMCQKYVKLYLCYIYVDYDETCVN